jgi:hypothetical protein
VVAAAAAFAPATASAQQPTVRLVPVDEVQVLAGADSFCPFDVVFTGTGTIAVTTFYDGDGNPVRQTVHGALTHTISSAWHTLVSDGPAPVHVDLSTGQTVDTASSTPFTFPATGSCSARRDG